MAGLTIASSFSACGGGADGGSPTPNADISAALDSALARPILLDSNSSPMDGVFLGVFREQALTDLVPAVAADLRRKPAAAMWFTRFGSSYPTSQIAYLHAQGMAAQVSWEPWGAHDEAIPLADINSGQWDAYIDQWGSAAAAQNIPFMLRFGHEFNGNWYPWSIDKNGGNSTSSTAYRTAFRRVVTRLRASGANHIKHIWCFNNTSVPAQSWNSPRDAYPGDDVVDWIGIDGYNFGTSQQGARWTSFRDVFRPAVELANQIASVKPIILAEMACSEVGGNKAAWISAIATELAQMPSVRALTWFDTQKETSWQLTSSDASWLAAIQMLEKQLFRGNATALMAVV